MLTKATAAAGAVGVPNIARIIAIVEMLAKLLGPVAVPIIEAWVAKLPLTPAQIAAIDALIEKILTQVP